MNNKKQGVILVLIAFVVVVLIILIGVFISRGIQEKDLTERQKGFYQAFNLAEAGLDRALVELKNNFDWTGVTAVALGSGEYSVVVNAVGLDERKVDTFGYIPSVSAAQQKVSIEAYIRKAIPGGFYDNAIYSAGDIDLNGSSYLVDGDVIYAGSIDNPDNITGSVTNDPGISPLARLNYAELRAISIGQGNVYDTARLADVQNNTDSFPASFWYSVPTDPADPATGVPNVVYVEDDLQLNGNIGTIGGFFVVVGDVITDPNSSSETTINGNGQVEGCIYTLGDFRVNGGGGGLNVDGGVWSGDESRLNGNTTIQYNAFYMQAINKMGLHADVQIISWRQL